jgi:hypothetical protein
MFWSFHRLLRAGAAASYADSESAMMVIVSVKNCERLVFTDKPRLHLSRMRRGTRVVSFCERGEGTTPTQWPVTLSRRSRRVASSLLPKNVDETTAGVGNGVARSSQDLSRRDLMSVDLRTSVVVRT